MRSFVVLFLLVLASSAASLRAQSVAFAWEGERAPLERERYFYAGDWPAMRPLIIKVRSVGKPNGFVPCAFSTYLKVPDDGGRTAWRGSSPARARGWPIIWR